MEVYHLGRTRFADQLSGEGAKLHGGRWNRIGQPCIYASESKALCILEYAANVSLDLLPLSLSITVYFIPDNSWKQFNENELPKNWNAVPVTSETKEWGTIHLQEKKILTLKLPSVIIPSEYNFIINPLHPDFKKVKIKNIHSFTFDQRIKR
jgi:RES domain-containing protein